MGVIRNFIADLMQSDAENQRADPEARFVAAVRAIAREEANTPVQVVSLANLPTEAPPGQLFRETTSGNLYMGNGTGNPLSRFVPSL